jgi:hypothetical protein
MTLEVERMRRPGQETGQQGDQSEPAFCAFPHRDSIARPRGSPVTVRLLKLRRVHHNAQTENPGEGTQSAALG